MALSTAKRVREIFKAKDERWSGDGFPTRNVLSYQRIAHEVSPFLLVDLVGPHDFDPAKDQLGADEMPYKGIEVVTLVYDGEIDHLDSRGNFSTLDAGDVQWATAGSGVVIEERHSEEFTANGGRLEMARVWVNLPAIHKLLPPRYQKFESGGLPRVDLPDDAGYARVVAGECCGIAGPAQTRTPLVMADLRLKQGKPIALPFPPDWTALLLVLDGQVSVENGQAVNTAELVQFDQIGLEATFQAQLNTSALLLAGEPILEPVTGQDGFVMNTQDQVISAMQDYRLGRLGEVSTEHETGVEE
jgi:redox-sensitive bicupin YhaK (pirin superfamily)